MIIIPHRMKMNHVDLLIELIDEPHYTIGSTDNSVRYEREYFQGVQNPQRVSPVSQHGIRLWKNDQELTSAIVSDVGGATTIHERSALISGNTLFLCCCYAVYSFSLPSLDLNWSKRLDPATCLGIYRFNDKFIIHGELTITQIDQFGNEEWTFGARDIFVTPDGTQSIKIHPDKIEATDWEGYTYWLDENGLEIR